MDFLSRPYGNYISVLFWYYVELAMYFRTVSYCKPGLKPPKPPAADSAAGGPAADDVHMAVGDAVVENEGEGIVAEAVILQEDGLPVCELLDTPKPKKKGTKRTRERDEVTAKVLNILEKDAEDDDEVSLALASIGKRIKKTLKEGQVDAVIDELNEVVGQHVRAPRSGNVMGYQRQPTIQQPLQMQPPPQQPPQPANFQPMPPPPLQRMDIGYDPITNNTYQNL